MADDTAGMQPAAMAPPPPDQGGGGVGSFVQGFANSFGQGLQSAGAILSPQVYKTQAIERQNALTNLLTGLKVSKERIAMQADQQVVAALKESGLQPGMTSQAQMDALSKIDPAILAQSGVGQQVLGEVYKKHQMEIQTGQQNLQLQNAQRLLNQQQMELNKPTEHFDAASGKLVRSYRDGRVETIDAAPPHAQRTTINVGNDMVQDAMVDKNGNVIKTLGEPSHKFAKSVAPVIQIGDGTGSDKLDENGMKVYEEFVKAGKPVPKDGKGKVDARILNQIGAHQEGGAGSGSITSKMQDYKTDQALLTDFAKGRAALSIKSINAVIEHQDVYRQIAKALDNGDIQLYNKWKGEFMRATGQTLPNDLKAAAPIIGSELVKAIVPTGGGVEERRDAEKQWNLALSNKQVESQIDNVYIPLMRGQTDALRKQYEATGRKDFEQKYFTDKTREILFKKAPAAPTATPKSGVDTSNPLLR